MCPISLNIQRIKLTDKHFPLEQRVIHLLDKTYQEINFKSYSNTIILCKLGKNLSELRMSRLILFHLFLLVLNLLLKLKDANYKSH